MRAGRAGAIAGVVAPTARAGANCGAAATASAGAPTGRAGANCGAAETADDPQLGADGRDDGVGVEPHVGDPDGDPDENVAGSAAIARGFANGMTLLALEAAGAGVTDTEVATDDSGTRCGECERDPVGGGAASRGFGVSWGSISGGATRVSTEVASPTSYARGIRGIGVMAGREFRYDIHARQVQDKLQRAGSAAT